MLQLIELLATLGDPYSLLNQPIELLKRDVFQEPALQVLSLFNPSLDLVSRQHRLGLLRFERPELLELRSLHLSHQLALLHVSGLRILHRN